MFSIPLQMMLVAVAGWVNREQLAIIDYLKEENRVLRELHGKRRLRFTDDQRRRLAVRGKALGRRLLRDVGTLVIPDTILRWHRELIARKYDARMGPIFSPTANRTVSRAWICWRRVVCGPNLARMRWAAEMKFTPSSVS